MIAKLVCKACGDVLGEGPQLELANLGLAESHVCRRKGLNLGDHLRMADGLPSRHHNFPDWTYFHEACKNVGLTAVQPNPDRDDLVWFAIDLNWAVANVHPESDDPRRLVCFDAVCNTFRFNIPGSGVAAIPFMSKCSMLMSEAYKDNELWQRRKPH